MVILLYPHTIGHWIFIFFQQSIIRRLGLTNTGYYITGVPQPSFLFIGKPITIRWGNSIYLKSGGWGFPCISTGTLLFFNRIHLFILLLWKIVLYVMDIVSYFALDGRICPAPSYKYPLSRMEDVVGTYL